MIQWVRPAQVWCRVCRPAALPGAVGGEFEWVHEESLAVGMMATGNGPKRHEWVPAQKP
jgi:hypothetical protein